MMKDEKGRKTPHPVALRDHPLPKVEGYEIFVGRPGHRNPSHVSGGVKLTRCLSLGKNAGTTKHSSAPAADWNGLHGWRIRRALCDVCGPPRTIFFFCPGTRAARVSRAMECGGLAPPCLQRLRWRLNLQPLPVGQLAVRRREQAPALQSRFATHNGRGAQIGVVDMHLETKASLRENAAGAETVFVSAVPKGLVWAGREA